MDQIITGWQRYINMGWIAALGSIAAAQASIQIGKYNAQIFNQQYAYENAKALQQREVYEKLDKPRLIKKQQQDYSNYFVSLLQSGFEVRGSAYDNLLEFQVNQQLDMDIADYNENIDFIDARNQSLLLQARGEGEKFKGRMLAGPEYIKAGASLLG